MTATERSKMLRRGIPSAFTVQDPVARQVLEALREAMLLLVQGGVTQVAEKAVAEGVKGLEEGEGIEIEPLGGGLFRLSCTVQPGGGGVSSGGASTLADLSDVDLDDPQDGDALVFESGKWVNGVGASDPVAPTVYTTLGSDTEGAEGAADDTWTVGDVDASGNRQGLWEWTQPRHAYFHEGDKKWYAYARKKVYSIDGRLVSESGETRIEIEAPVP